MSYFGFHLRFNLPLLTALAVAAGASFWSPASLVAAGCVLLAVFAFTIPWDNYAAAKAIWGFPEKRYWIKIGWLPFEEYLFFALQSASAMFLTRFLLDHLPTRFAATPLPFSTQGFLLGGVVLLWILAGVIGGPKIPAHPKTHYAWHLLYWFLPVIGLQWIVGWHRLTPHWPHLLIVTTALGSYLSGADAIAIRSGIWWVDDRQTTGQKLLNVLPWEEAVFFFITSLVVAQSYLLFLPTTP